MNVPTSVFEEHTVCRRDGLWIYLTLTTLPAVPVGTTGQLLLMKPHVSYRLWFLQDFKIHIRYNPKLL